MKKTLLLWILFPALVGCASVQEKIAEGVNRYCMEPATTRAAIRAEVNARTAPNSIRVDCAADHGADAGGR